MKEVITIETWMTRLGLNDKQVIAFALILKRAEHIEPISMNELATILETPINEAIKFVNALELKRIITPVDVRIVKNDFFKTFKMGGYKDEVKNRYSKKNSLA